MSLIRNVFITLAAAAVGLPVTAAMLPGPSDDFQMTHSVSLTAVANQTRTGDALQVGDTFCDDQETIGISLVEDYGEAYQFSVWGQSYSKIDFWGARETGTWTVVYTRPDQIACVAASGTGWNGESKPTSVARLIGFTG